MCSSLLVGPALHVPVRRAGGRDNQAPLHCATKPQATNHTYFVLPRPCAVRAESETTKQDTTALCCQATSHIQFVLPSPRSCSYTHAVRR